MLWCVHWPSVREAGLESPWGNVITDIQRWVACRENTAHDPIGRGIRLIHIHELILTTRRQWESSSICLIHTVFIYSFPTTEEIMTKLQSSVFLVHIHVFLYHHQRGSEITSSCLFGSFCGFLRALTLLIGVEWRLYGDGLGRKWNWIVIGGGWGQKWNVWGQMGMVVISVPTQKGKQFWILLEQEMMWWQWYQLDHMQIICTSLQRDNHASTSPLSLTGWMPFLPPNQQRQSTSCRIADLYCWLICLR